MFFDSSSEFYCANNKNDRATKITGNNIKSIRNNYLRKKIKFVLKPIMTINQDSQTFQINFLITKFIVSS